MRQISLLLLGTIAVLISGCLPPRPQVTVCVTDKLPLMNALNALKANPNDPAVVGNFIASVDKLAYCHCSDGGNPPKKTDLSWGECDNHEALSATDGKAMKDYVLSLEQQILEDEKGK